MPNVPNWPAIGQNDIDMNITVTGAFTVGYWTHSLQSGSLSIPRIPSARSSRGERRRDALLEDRRGCKLVAGHRRLTPAA
jgi:hypothetical protein